MCHFKQKLKDGEVGLSTMPHKVNPIDFENGTGMANVNLTHISNTVTISRWQRDLTDFYRHEEPRYMFRIHKHRTQFSIKKGLDKLELNNEKLIEDLNDSWEVLTSKSFQTI